MYDERRNLSIGGALVAALFVLVAQLPTMTVALSPKQLAAAPLDLSNGWLPTEDLYWIDADTLGILAARRGQDGPEYTWLTVDADGTQTEVLQLANTTHCRLSDGSFLFQGHSSQSPDPVVVTWPTPGASSTEALDDCQSTLSDARNRFSPRFGEIDSVATDGSRWAGVIGRGDEGAEIVLFTENDDLGRWPVAEELWKDTVVIDPLPDAGGFLIYPSINAARRADLVSDTPGIPVFRITADAALQRQIVPWADWNAEGLYRIAPTRGGLMAASVTGYDQPGDTSGFYLETADWQQTRHGDVLPESLRMSPDGCQAAWLERPAGAANSAPRLMRANTCEM